MLHVTDISWKRVNHPTDALSIGQQVKVQVIRFNPETQRISLGMKQLEADPWEGVAAKYPIEARFTGRVTNITDYGAFVELEAGVEGLVHVSEMSWTKKNVHPGKIVSTSQEVEVMVLDVDEQLQSLGRLRREPPSRLGARGRNQEHHRVRPVRRPARRHRRHGPLLRPRLAAGGRGCGQEIQEGRYR
jgi:predicted RNA-binding protein with RPS1 domain